jgi:hypothetical protein
MTTKNNATTTIPARTINVGLVTLVAELTALLDQAEARLGPQPPALTGTDKRRLSKPRKGAEKLLVSLAPVVEQNGLGSAALNAAQMMERLADAEILKPLDTRLEKIAKRVSDELFAARSDAWEMALQFYAVLKRRARHDGELKGSLEPLSKMFSYRHSSVKEEVPTKQQTRAKARLKGALALAERNDVTLPEAEEASLPRAE